MHRPSEVTSQYDPPERTVHLVGEGGGGGGGGGGGEGEGEGEGGGGEGGTRHTAPKLLEQGASFQAPF